MDSSVVLVPCYWPTCEKRMRLNNLASHLEIQHRVNGGFGCDQCGFTDAAEDTVSSHLLEIHGRQEKPRRAALALTHYYRKRYQETDPSARNIPLSSFWTRGGKPQLKSENNNCHECGDVISPYTKSAVIKHLRQRHRIVVDLDFTSISNRYSRYDFQNDGHEELDDLIDEDDDGMECSDENLDEVLDEELRGDDEEGLAELVDAEYHKEQALQKHTTHEHEVLPFSMPMIDRDSDHQREAFMGCIEETYLEDVQDVLKMYKTILHEGCAHRVNQNLSLDTDLEPTKVVYAVRTYDRWRCEVPQCGATFDQTFAIDMHLHAHGDMVLTKWYCGDASCYTGTEMIFDDHANFVSHITTEHMGSKYSTAAGRRVPKRDVLVTRLLEQLKFIKTSEEAIKHSEMGIKGSLATEAVEVRADMQPEAEDHLPYDDPNAYSLDQEMRAWAKFAKSVGLNEEPESDGDAGILEPYWENLLLRLNLNRPHPVVMPPKYWVETLTSYVIMDGKEVKKFLRPYRKLCKMLGTEHPDALRKELFSPPQTIPTKDELQNTDREAQNQQAFQLYEDDESQDNNQHIKDLYGCPWPDCEHATGLKCQTSVHFLTVHLKCDWRCPEEGCEYCVYLEPLNFERHRMSCHIGSPLQCGHHSCNEVLISDRFLSRGHMNYRSLQNHFEAQFNQNLRTSRVHSSKLDSGLISVARLAPKELPSDVEYLETFGGRSVSYLTPDRRSYRHSENHRFLARHRIQPEDVEVRGSVTCTGFWYKDRHFRCSDSVSLQLDTAMLIFVPSRLLFTVVPTCDYCIHIMSLISRSVAALPLPFHFGPKLGQNGRNREGIGSFITDHASFKQLMREKPLRIPTFAKKYEEFRKSSPGRIFIVDFETVRRSQPGLPLRLLELTIRDGNGRIVVACVINEAGVTNLQFETQLQRSGYASAVSLNGVRRIRGPPEDVFPPNAKTPREIMRILLRAGLNPESLWVEYSTAYFDYRCMEILIKDAGMSVEAILPPREDCWTVIREFMLCLPGLASYKLGSVAKLMNPANPHLKRLHYSDADTGVLYDILNRWIYQYGESATARSE